MIANDAIPAAARVSPLARVLTEVRSHGIPAWAVAEEAGISPALLSKVSRGRVPATPDTAEAVARALGRSVGELFPRA